MHSAIPLLLLLPGLGAAAEDKVTYNKDIAPLLWKNCASCHRPGQVAPFSLLTYKDAAKRADFLASVARKRRMPPWKPESGYGEFRHERRLSVAEIKLLSRWADDGAPEGDAKDLPPAPKFTSDWQLGEPDLVIKMPAPFNVPADGPDIYQCFPVPLPIQEDRQIAAVEFRPGNPRVVHHSLIFLDRSGYARQRADKEKGPGFRSFGGPGFIPSGALGAWVPGAVTERMPDGLGMECRKGSVLVIQIHYHPDGKQETDQSSVGIYFVKKPAQRLFDAVSINSSAIDIPPGAKHHVVKAQTTPLPVDILLLNIGPHMHYLGREVKCWAETPEGKTVPLIWIKDWDFNWQGGYSFAKPIPLPKGTIFKTEGTFDNSADNPLNPNSPPKRVRYGEATTDEMLLCIAGFVTVNPADRKVLKTWPDARFGTFQPPRNPTAKTPTTDLLPPGGWPIPTDLKKDLGKYDTQAGGRLYAEEIDGLPAQLRDKVRQLIIEDLKKIPLPPED